MPTSQQQRARGNQDAHVPTARAPYSRYDAVGRYWERAIPGSREALVNSVLAKQCSYLPNFVSSNFRRLERQIFNFLVKP